MPKEEYKTMIKMSMEDFLKKYSKDWDDYVWLYEITEKLYWLWKYVDFSDWMDWVVFEDNSLNEMYDEYSFHILDKKIIKNIINEYSENVANYYKWLIDWINTHRFLSFELWKSKKTAEQRNHDIDVHLANRVRDFSKNKVFNIEEGPISSSWEYEYAIFELIRIYREFDHEKDVLLYYWY